MQSAPFVRKHCRRIMNSDKQYRLQLPRQEVMRELDGEAERVVSLKE